MANYTDQELIDKGFVVPVFRAVELAGGARKVAHAFGYKTQESVYRWFRKDGACIPASLINRLCQMGGNKVTPAEILAAMDKHKAV